MTRPSPRMSREAERRADNRLPAVQVPATSANLGPGFDAFAAAIDLHIDVRVTERAERRVVVEGEGSGELPEDDTNLIWQALLRLCDAFGVQAPDVSLHAASQIPLERGLGSSAAAAVAGGTVARALTGAPAGDQDLIDLAATFEGHADNAAAAVLGGLVVCRDGQARRLEPTGALRPVVCVPTGRQSTEAARGLLPSTVALTDAAANGARAAVVLAGLCGAMAWDPRAMTDVLHEPARLAAMPESGALVHALRGEGFGACLSGAGPSVLVMVAATDPHAVAAVEQVVAGVEGVSAGWQAIATTWERAGARVRCTSATHS